MDARITRFIGHDFMKPRSNYRIKVIDNVARVLSLFCGKTAELGVTEVSRQLGLPKSVAHRLLLSLRDNDLLEQNEETHKYRLSLKMFEIGMAYRRGLPWDRVATPFLEDLAARLGENINLAVLSGSEIVYVQMIQGTKPIRVVHQVGERNYAHSTGLGKVLLAFQPPEELEAWLETAQLPKLTPKTITSREELRSELDHIRRRGYAKDASESADGVGCIAAPIVDCGGTVRAAISISGICQQMFGSREEELVDAILRTAEAISATLQSTDARILGPGWRASETGRC